MRRTGSRFVLWIVLVACAMVPCSLANADGKMFSREQVPPNIPYQRALIMHKDNVQTLVLQSKYHYVKGGVIQPAPVGWVVPVPAVPEVSSADAEKTAWLFRNLGLNSRATETRFGPWIVFGGIAVFGVVTITLMIREVRFAKTTGASYGRVAVHTVMGLVFIVLLAGSLMPMLAKGSGRVGVEILSEQTAGIYEVKVVTATSSQGLIQWLNENQYNFGPQDTACIDAYLAQGWCFAVANIDAVAAAKDGGTDHEGLAAPLILRFPVAEPTYPVALTGTGGYDTEILLYLVTDSKLECQGPMPLLYAGGIDVVTFRHLLESPMGVIVPEAWQEGSEVVLCKFKAKLTPQQMARDLVFCRAADQSHFREHKYLW